MILADVNVLVHAFRSDASDHVSCRAWLDHVINGEARYGMSPQVLSSVVRITTHQRIFVRPNRLKDVMEFCDVLLGQPHCVVVQPGERHWGIFTRLCIEADARGRLAPDAWFAALAIESGCQWISLDRDYARFPGLQWSLPESPEG
jgi:uncharacterized protein